MFGYVTADRSALTEEQLARYQGCYCGLCRTIGREYGVLQRMALNYDLTFLALLLSSLYEPEEQTGHGRCLAHPLTIRDHWQNQATTYAAAMNMALAYHNARDDWSDDRTAKSLIQSAVFRHSAKQAAAAWPRQWKAMETCMNLLSQLEAADSQEPDLGANAFGALLAEIFDWKEDHWSPLLRQLGHALGRFIYLMDAVLDLPADLKKKRYNPLRSRAETADAQTLYLPVLHMLMGECTDAFERLPLIQDLDLLRNIIYSGVWSRYQSQKEAPHV